MGLALGLGIGIPFGGALQFPLVSGATSATLDVDFINNRAWNATMSSIASLLACSRATPTTAYYTNVDGSLTGFAANTLRYGNNGLLAEAAATNLLLRSEAFDDAAWTNTATVSADAGLAPNGATTADKVTFGSGANVRQIKSGITANSAYTISVWAKKPGGVSDATNMRITTNNTSAWDTGISQRFTLTTSWQRLTLSGNVINSGTDLYVMFGTPDASSNADATCVGDVLLWGAQLETGSAVSSYIPTVAATVTRAVDVVTFSDVTWLGTGANSLYAEWTATGAAGTVWVLDATNDTTLAEATGAAKLSDAGATFSITTGNTATTGTTAKAAMRIAANDVALTLNAGTVGTDATTTVPGTITASRLGVDLSGSNSLNGYIRRVACFKAASIANGALQTLAT